MLVEFLDKAASFLDRRFLLAYWYPTLLSLSAALLIYSWPNGWKPLNQCFSALQGGYSLKLITILGVLFFTLILAHLIQAFSYPFIQFWEGYWPESFWSWYKRVKKVDKKRIQLKREEIVAVSNNDLEEYADCHEKLFYEYPREDRLLPTRLGNFLRASEDYAQDTYGMQIVFWWPRLWLIIPESVQNQIDDSLAPIIAFLNLATQIGVISVIGFIYLCMQYESLKYVAIFEALITLILGLIITTIAYRGAVSQAKIYGNLIRSVADIYRFDLLKALNQSMPSKPDEEKKLWENLFRWVYLNEQDSAPQYAQDQSKT